MQAIGLSKRFGRTMALRSLDLEVSPGERLAIFGPNGSGKTTLLRILAGLTRPSAGSLNFFGDDLLSQRPHCWRRIGVVAHQSLLYSDLTAEENLSFYGRMFGLVDYRDRAFAALARVGMEGRRQQRVLTLSRGMQQRLALARALLHDPDVLLLDEPDTGLDQDASTRMPELLQIGTGMRTVIMATHDLALGLRLCQRFVVLAAGRVVLDEPTRGLMLGDLEKKYAASLQAA